MLDTLMALWNRGYRGRLMAITLIFCCMCISISLLFITVGSTWGSIFPGGRTRGMAQNTNTAYATNTTTTPGLYASPTTATSVTVPSPCITTTTGRPAESPRASATTHDCRHHHAFNAFAHSISLTHPISFTNAFANPTGKDAYGRGDTHCDIDACSHSYRYAYGCRNAYRYIHACNDADHNGIANGYTNARCF